MVSSRRAPGGLIVISGKVGSMFEEAMQKLTEALEALKASKPNDRSEKDRYVAITDQEKVIAFYNQYVVNP